LKDRNEIEQNFESKEKFKERDFAKLIFTERAHPGHMLIVVERYREQFGF